MQINEERGRDLNANSAAPDVAQADSTYSYDGLVQLANYMCLIVLCKLCYNVSLFLGKAKGGHSTGLQFNSVNMLFFLSFKVGAQHNEACMRIIPVNSRFRVSVLNTHHSLG